LYRACWRARAGRRAADAHYYASHSRKAAAGAAGQPAFAPGGRTGARAILSSAAVDDARNSVAYIYGSIMFRQTAAFSRAVAARFCGASGLVATNRHVAQPCMETRSHSVASSGKSRCWKIGGLLSWLAASGRAATGGAFQAGRFGCLRMEDSAFTRVCTL